MQLAASLTAVFQTSFLEPSRRPAVPLTAGFWFLWSEGKTAPRIVLWSLRHITPLLSELPEVGDLSRRGPYQWRPLSRARKFAALPAI